MDEIMAPAVVIIRYLGMMRRLLLALEDAGRRVDFEKLILCGRVADALHNAPSVLRCYDPARELEVEADLCRLRAAVPSALRAIALGIIGDEIPSSGVQNDYDLAPRGHFDRLLEVLANILINGRNRWDRAWPVTNPDLGNDKVLAAVRGVTGTSPANATDVEDAIWWGRIASAFSDVPMGLIHWSTYDLDRLQARASALAAEMPKRLLGYCANWLPLMVHAKG